MAEDLQEALKRISLRFAKECLENYCTTDEVNWKRYTILVELKPHTLREHYIAKFVFLENKDDGSFKNPHTQRIILAPDYAFN